jgi:hypothetical protein
MGLEMQWISSNMQLTWVNKLETIMQHKNQNTKARQNVIAPSSSYLLLRPSQNNTPPTPYFFSFLHSLNHNFQN